MMHTKNEHYYHFIEKTFQSFRAAYYSDGKAMLDEAQYEPLTRKLINIGADMYVYFNPDLIAAHNYIRIAENTQLTEDEYNEILSHILKVDEDNEWLKKYVSYLKLIRSILKGDQQTINQYTNNALNKVNNTETLSEHIKHYTENICNYWCDFYKHRMITEGIILM